MFLYKWYKSNNYILGSYKIVIKIAIALFNIYASHLYMFLYKWFKSNNYILGSYNIFKEFLRF